MGIINSLFGLVINLLSVLLPSMGLSPAFIGSIDSALSFLIEVMHGASYFLPVDTMLMCLGVIIAVDNFSLISRLVKWFLSFIP